MVHHSTENVWPWRACGSHDQGRVVVPAVYVETLFRRASVTDPASLAPVKFMVKCLGLPEYLEDALDLLIDEGLFKTDDGDGDVVDVQYEHLDDLVDAAGELILGMPDRPELQVKADSFEWAKDLAVRSLR